MIKLEKQGNIAVLTVSRPEALNALNSQTLDELYDTAVAVRNDEEIRCLIVTGEGKAFVAGADIGEMQGLSAEEGRLFGLKGHRAFCAIEALPIPVIAAVNGFALGGGCELALCADIRLASEKAKFGQPETGLGITPGFGGTQRLPRTVGVSKAMELILTAKMIKADEALEIGLVDRVYPPEQLMEEAIALANTIAANAPVAVRNAKAAIRRFTGANLAWDLGFEADMFGACFATEDQKNAMQAFLDKADKPEFTGK